MGWFAAWWREPDHFDWLTGHLQAHGLSKNTRSRADCRAARIDRHDEAISGRL
jgi:hypothetical protein